MKVGVALLGESTSSPNPASEVNTSASRQRGQTEPSPGEMPVAPHRVHEEVGSGGEDTEAARFR
jgi:hypothetical protein